MSTWLMIIAAGLLTYATRLSSILLYGRFEICSRGCSYSNIFPGPLISRGRTYALVKQPPSPGWSLGHICCLANKKCDLYHFNRHVFPLDTTIYFHPTLNSYCNG
jgi:hypothetical protein